MDTRDLSRLSIDRDAKPMRARGARRWWNKWTIAALAIVLAAAIVAEALGFSIAMGVAGGFLPSLRAARLEIVDALRAA